MTTRTGPSAQGARGTRTRAPLGLVALAGLCVALPAATGRAQYASGQSPAGGYPPVSASGAAPAPPSPTAGLAPTAGPGPSASPRVRLTPLINRLRQDLARLGPAAEQDQPTTLNRLRLNLALAELRYAEALLEPAAAADPEATLDNINQHLRYADYLLATVDQEVLEPEDRRALRESNAVRSLVSLGKFQTFVVQSVAGNPGELQRLRERVAALEARPAYNPYPYPTAPPAYPYPIYVPTVRWCPPGR